MALLASLMSLLGCDAQRIAELEEGIATEADVRARFGEPENIWDGAGGVRILEYTRQPAGHENYMISIGPDGRMTALRQVLNTENLARIQPGQTMEEVRRSLGKPMKVTPYALRNETEYDWRWRDGPNVADSKVFTAVFDSTTLRVKRTGSVTDPDLRAENR
jgi:hypothetical protein